MKNNLKTEKICYEGNIISSGDNDFMVIDLSAREDLVACQWKIVYRMIRVELYSRKKVDKYSIISYNCTVKISKETPLIKKFANNIEVVLIEINNNFLDFLYYGVNKLEPKWVTLIESQVIEDKIIFYDKNSVMKKLGIDESALNSITVTHDYSNKINQGFEF